MREVIKRDGSHVAFDESKIYQAILKAMKYGSGIINENVANKIAHEINQTFAHQHKTPTIFQRLMKDIERFNNLNVKQIQQMTVF